MLCNVLNLQRLLCPCNKIYIKVKPNKVSLFKREMNTEFLHLIQEAQNKTAQNMYDNKEFQTDNKDIKRQISRGGLLHNPCDKSMLTYNKGNSFEYNNSAIYTRLDAHIYVNKLEVEKKPTLEAISFRTFQYTQFIEEPWCQFNN